MKLLILATLAVLLSSVAWAATGEVSFTPTGFKFPIMKITMSKNSGFTSDAMGHQPTATNDQVLYTCASTDESQCLVDLTSQDALDAISAKAKGVSVAVGSYDMLTLATCADTKTGANTISVWLKGFFGAGATPTYFYTDPVGTNGVVAASPDTSVAAKAAAGFTEISWGCGTKIILLASPLVVGDPSAAPSPSPSPSSTAEATTALDQTLTVIVDNTNLANSIPNTSSGMGGCKGSTGRGLCVNIPALLPYVGTATVSTKRYLLSHSNVSVAAIDDAKANAQVIVPMAGTTALTVFAGPYYSETSVANGANVTSTALQSNFQGPTYNTSTDVSSFVDNGDDTISFKQGGSLDSNGGVFTNFSLAGGTNSLTSRDGTVTWYYHAVKQ